jgi:hypothetical protein
MRPAAKTPVVTIINFKQVMETMGVAGWVMTVQDNRTYQILRA